MRRLMLFFLLLGLISLSGWAQEDDECMLCHGEPDFARDLPSGGVESLYIDAERYSHGLHAEEGCISCHLNIEEVPHEEELEPVDCGNCHDQTEEYSESLHGKMLANGDTDVARCSDCHDYHYTLTASDPLSKVNPRNLPETCGKCHSNPALVKKHMISVQSPSESYLKSVHGKKQAGGNANAASCNDCHGTHDIKPAHDPQSKVYRRNIHETCGECHPQETEVYMQSIHGKALMAGIQDAPVCTDCHGEHDITAPGQAGSQVGRKQVVRSTCPKCHDDEEVMSKFGIETQRQASYMDSYHGMATMAGSDIVASCTSCHGVHNILPHSDPESTVHIDNLTETCAQCHENATENFAKGKVHIMPTDPEQKALGIVRLIYIILIAAVIGGMTLHNTIMMARHAMKKFRQELKGPNTYQRFTTGLTIGHLLLTIIFITLAVTGFALRYPESWWARHLFVGDTGLALRGTIHRLAGVGLTLIMVANGIYLTFTKSGRKELGALMMKLGDLKDALHNLAYAVNLTKNEPKFGRYSYIEKFEYWGLWWGSFIMVITGFSMWFVNTFLQYLPKLWLDVFALIHFYEAWLAVLTIVIWHLYYMIFDPHTYPMNWSFITGHITEEDFKERHPLEYEQVMKERAEAENKDND